MKNYNLNYRELTFQYLSQRDGSYKKKLTEQVDRWRD